MKTYKLRKRNDTENREHYKGEVPQSSSVASKTENQKQTVQEVSLISSAISYKKPKVKYTRGTRKKSSTESANLSKSTYLTPDKSIHVKRLPDMFDQLLTPEYYTKLLEPRIKPPIEKFNLSTSSSSTDSEKENSQHLQGENVSIRGTEYQKHTEQEISPILPVKSYKIPKVREIRDNNIIELSSSTDLETENPSYVTNNSSDINRYQLKIETTKHLQGGDDSLNLIHTLFGACKLDNNSSNTCKTDQLSSTPRCNRKQTICSLSPIAKDDSYVWPTVVKESNNSTGGSDISLFVKKSISFDESYGHFVTVRRGNKSNRKNNNNLNTKEEFSGNQVSLRKDVSDLDCTYEMFETFREISSTGDLIVDSSKNLTVSPCLNNELIEKYEMNQSEASTVDQVDCSGNLTISPYLNNELIEKYEMNQSEAFTVDEIDCSRNLTISPCLNNELMEKYEMNQSEAFTVDEIDCSRNLTISPCLNNEIIEKYEMNQSEASTVDQVHCSGNLTISPYLNNELIEKYEMNQSEAFTVDEIDCSRNLTISPCLNNELMEKYEMNQSEAFTVDEIDCSRNLTISPCLNNEIIEKYEMNQSEAFTVDEETKTDISEVSLNLSTANNNSEGENNKHPLVLQPGKKWARSLSVYKRISKISDPVDETLSDCEDFKNKLKRNRRSTNNIRKFMEFQGTQNDTTNSRRTTFLSKAVRPSVTILQEIDTCRLSFCATTVSEDIKGFWDEDCNDTLIEISELSSADRDEVAGLEELYDSSGFSQTARDVVLRRCGQSDALLFDECYPDTDLKNCRKIGEGVYGEVFLWRARDSQARVLKIIPVAGTTVVNGENQKQFNEVLSEIVIATELSTLRTPIDEVAQHVDEKWSVEKFDLSLVQNATDVFNKVIAVRCVYGSYPSSLLHLWDLYDECKTCLNDDPRLLPIDQQFIVLELANAGEDLECYKFTNAKQAFSILIQVAYGLAVAEEAFQFEHRDLHWGNVLIAPTEEKFATFVVRGRVVRVPRHGLAATVIDYTLSRMVLRPPAGSPVALFHDLAGDNSLFEADGDYQFDVYREMQLYLKNDWKNYEPYTNILWLHYTSVKMITEVHYTKPNTAVHKHYINKLKSLENQLREYPSATELVLKNKALTCFKK